MSMQTANFSIVTSITFAIGAMLLVLGYPPASAHATIPRINGATDVIESFHETLLEAMQQEAQMGFPARSHLIEKKINQAFDMPTIARLILGEHWNTLATTEREGFIQLFTRLTVATYADNFSSYHGEQFLTLSSKEMPRNRVLVLTKMNRIGKDRVHFDYLLHHKDNGWRVVSVSSNGVNDLSLKRTEYSRLIQKNGFSQLLKTLQDSVEKTTSDNQKTEGENDTGKK